MAMTKRHVMSHKMYILNGPKRNVQPSSATTASPGREPVSQVEDSAHTAKGTIRKLGQGGAPHQQHKSHLDANSSATSSPGVACNASHSKVSCARTCKNTQNFEQLGAFGIQNNPASIVSRIASFPFPPLTVVHGDVNGVSLD
ncbi:hypothetical protein CR513_34417, partial [Mucuna pruriens]